MTISLFDLFSIGIGPSSSHTVGPMKAAYTFSSELAQTSLTHVKRISIELFGSLAFTGKGHGTDKAILLGLEGQLPHLIDPAYLESRYQSILSTHEIHLNQMQLIPFHYEEDMLFNFKDLLPEHTNGMRFTAYDEQNTPITTRIFYSIGGGFIIESSETKPAKSSSQNISVPYPFESAQELLHLAETHQLSISEMMLANESTLHPNINIKDKILHIATIMKESIEKGSHSEGVLPGGLNVKRRAPLLYQKLTTKGKPSNHTHADSMEWLNLYAIAVNEENAAGGRIVTAPTNGAAGVLPAVLYYYLNFYPESNDDDIVNFLLTAGAIGILYKKRASISGAEVGCQGEVGSACSMAAGALTAVLNGTIYQIENAAEIAMEHHLGLTCDPINGLVQIPCIERNAMAAVKAVNAARLALLGDGQHYVSLDKVIATMKQTGKDMMTIYKETSLGGLAANLPEC